MSKRLEALSEKVRKGIPINFAEGIEVIEYQERLQADRERKRNKTVIGRLINWIQHRYGI